jgi:hypothetical protein
MLSTPQTAGFDFGQLSLQAEVAKAVSAVSASIILSVGCGSPSR